MQEGAIGATKPDRETPLMMNSGSSTLYRDVRERRSLAKKATGKVTMRGACGICGYLGIYGAP